MEIELKFVVPEERFDAVEAAVKQGEFKVTSMQAHYFDTPGKALASRGIALRLRKEGDRWIQTVKAMGHSLVAREEHNVEVHGFAETGPVPDTSLHHGSVAGDLLLEALDASAETLVEIYHTKIERITRDIPLVGGVVELALDNGLVQTHGGPSKGNSAPVRELEMEVKEGELQAVVQTAIDWIARHGLFLSTISKAERGERLLAAHWGRPAEKAKPLTADHGALPAGRELQKLVVGHCLHQVMSNASELAEGGGTDAHVHQLRVGLRRLRTALRELAGLADGSFDPRWEAPLKRVFRRLGELRDRGQALERFGHRLRDAGAPPMARLKSADMSAAQIIRSADFQQTLVQLLAFTATTDEGIAEDSSLSPKATRRALAKRVKRLFKRATRDIVGFQEWAPEDQHRVRKRLKRLRYLAEFLGPAMKHGHQSFLKRLKPAQSALGALNDHQVAEALYRTIAAEDPRAWFAVGWLAAQREQLLTDCDRTLQRVRKPPGFQHGAFR